MAEAQTSYMTTGMTVGSAFGPWGTVIGAAAGAAADIASAPADPSSAKANFQNNLNFDNSGWNVGYKNSTINSDALTSNEQGGAQGNSDPFGFFSGAGGTSADAQFSNSLGFNNSGWNVAFPDAAINSTAKTTTKQGGAQESGAKEPSVLGSEFSYAVLIIGAVLALKWMKKKKSA